MYARALLACLRSACLPAQLLSFSFSFSYSFSVSFRPCDATPLSALLQVQYWIILLQRSSTKTSCAPYLSVSLNCAPATSASATVLAKHNDVPRREREREKLSQEAVSQGKGWRWPAAWLGRMRPGSRSKFEGFRPRTARIGPQSASAAAVSAAPPRQPPTACAAAAMVAPSNLGRAPNVNTKKNRLLLGVEHEPRTPKMLCSCGICRGDSMH